MNFEQPIRDVNSVIGVDADQVGVEGGMVDLREREVASSLIETGAWRLRASNLSSLKVSKISTGSVDIFVENLVEGSRIASDLGIPNTLPKNIGNSIHN